MVDRAAAAARARARQARIRADAERDASDRRVERAVAAVFLAQEDIAAAEARITAALAGLRGEGRTLAQIAALTGLATPQVRRLLRPAPAGDASPQDGDASPAPDGAAGGAAAAAREGTPGGEPGAAGPGAVG